MDFSSLQGVTSSTAPNANGANKESELDRQAFLKLFTTQLQNQNPLEPVKNEAFIGQLAQFSTLEATSSMSNSFSTFIDEQRAQNLTRGAALIGKKVFMENGVFHQIGGASIEGSLNLRQSADGIAISVKDAKTGTVLNRFDLGSQKPGEVSFIWNGGDSEGKQAPAGDYIFTAEATKNGQTRTLTTFAPREIRGISWDHEAGTAYLDLEGGYVLPLEHVKKISS